MKANASRRFQVTGHCSPARHYMVDLSGRLAGLYLREKKWYNSNNLVG